MVNNLIRCRDTKSSLRLSHQFIYDSSGVFIKIILLDRCGLFEQGNCLQRLSWDEFGALICVLCSNVSTNSTTLVKNKSIIILGPAVSISFSYN
jgi:hypothetical protein